MLQRVFSNSLGQVNPTQVICLSETAFSVIVSVFKQIHLHLKIDFPVKLSEQKVPEAFTSDFQINPNL